MGRYKIKHSYKDVIIIPVIAIVDKELEFLVNKEDKEVVTTDGIISKVEKCNIFNICELEKDVKEIYNIDCWSFLKRWYNYDKRIDSLMMIKMKLKKIE